MAFVTNATELCDELKAKAPADATHLSPYHESELLGFFYKKEHNRHLYSYGNNWRTLDLRDCDDRVKLMLDNLIPIIREPEQSAEDIKEIVTRAILENDARKVVQADLEVSDDFPGEGFILLPDWALCENVHKMLVPGTQLATKDGRLTGNAHIISTRSVYWAESFDTGNRVIYDCLTDAGNKISLTERELYNQFYIGVFISHVNDVLDKFDRDNLFLREPK